MRTMVDSTTQLDSNNGCDLGAYRLQHTNVILEGAVDLGTEDMEDDQSSLCSPRFWSFNPKGFHSLDSQDDFQIPSPSSRALRIARGRSELMEMVREMPEPCYELSLTDLVEQRIADAQEECLLQDKDDSEDDVVLQRVKVKRQDSSMVAESKAKVIESRSNIDGRGLLLKLFFPVPPIGLRRTNNRSSSPTAFSRVSPRPEASEKSFKAAEREGSKRRGFVESGSGSGGSSSNTASSGNSRSNTASSGHSRSNPTSRGISSCSNSHNTSTSKR